MSGSTARRSWLLPSMATSTAAATSLWLTAMPMSASSLVTSPEKSTAEAKACSAELPFSTLPMSQTTHLSSSRKTSADRRKARTENSKTSSLSTSSGTSCGTAQPSRHGAATRLISIMMVSSSTRIISMAEERMPASLVHIQTAL